MDQSRSSVILLLGLGFCLSACLEKKEPETILKGEVGGAKVSSIQDMYDSAREEKISTVRMNRDIRRDKERWSHADQRRRQWVKSAMESGYLDSDYTKKKPRQTESAQSDDN